MASTALIISARAESLSAILQTSGLTVANFDDGSKAAAQLNILPPADYVWLELPLKGIAAGELVGKIKARSPQAYVSIISDAEMLPLATALLDSCASDVLAAPYTEQTVKVALQRAQKLRVLQSEIAYHRERITTTEELIGRCEKVRTVLQLHKKLVAAPQPVLICGEPGTGKDLLARTIHRQCSRAASPFIYVDCAAYPENLLEEELFGPKDAAPGVLRRRPIGCLELARGGTLVLNEISRLSKPLQQRLAQQLKKSEPKEEAVRLIGLHTQIPGANTPALDDELNGALLPANLPPLRERNGDILLIADFLVRHLGTLYGKPKAALEPAAKEVLSAHAWPGNVKELKLCIETAVLASDGAIKPGALRFAGGATTRPQPQAPKTEAGAAGPVLAPPPPDNDQVSFKVGQPLANMEMEMIKRTVAMTGGNRTQAAAILGISVRTLYTKLLAIEPVGKTDAQ